MPTIKQGAFAPACVASDEAKQPTVQESATVRHDFTIEDVVRRIAADPKFAQEFIEFLTALSAKRRKGGER